MMKSGYLYCILALLLCLGVFVGCTPATPPDEQPPEELPPEEQPPEEQPSEGNDPGTTEDPTEDPDPANDKYVYTEAEYSAQIPLFGTWEDYFAESTRENLYTTTAKRLENGLYEMSRGEVKTEGVRTYASVDRSYSPAMHVNVDAYIVSPSYAKAYQKAGYEIIGMSGSFNKSGYGDGNPEVLQRNAEGTTDGLWNSVVLTRDVILYNIRNTVKQWINRTNWRLGFVEPEMFRDGQYGTAYKDLWETKFKEPWSDPIADVRSIFLSQRLNTWTHSNAIKMYVSYINREMDEDQNLLYSLAPHSTLAYTTFLNGVTNGYVHMMGTGLVKSVTGQTWSNTIENKIRYEGKHEKHTFINAYVDYGTYLDAANYYGAEFFALCDPMSDTFESQPEEYWRELCHQQLVASLQYSEINRWELIWTNRSFMNVSPEYRSEQLNIHNALLDISGAEYSATAGTPGITYLLGDTLSWQTKNTAFAENAYDGFWGVAAPLVFDGIPLRTMAMELITSAEDLKDVSVLIVSYDNQKPLYENANIAIAEWVKQGGTLLYLGGPDAYLSIPEAWWNQEGKGGSPTGNLLQHLGMGDSIYAETLSKSSKLLWTGGEVKADHPDYKDSTMPVGNNPYTYYFEGSGYTTLLSTDDDHDIGITFSAGEGTVIMVGLSTTDYTDSACGADLMRMLTAKALESTEYEYVKADAFVAQRGDYTAVYPLRGTYTLSGTYINIFSPDAPIVVNPVVAEGEAALYRRVADLSSLTVPTVMSAGGFVQSIEEAETVTTVTLYAAENALIPIRVAAPAGYTAAAVTVTYSGGESSAAHTWDAATNSILVKATSTPTSSATVKITWAKNGTPLADTTYENFTIAVNSAGEDEEFIVSNAGGKASEKNRFCDNDAKIVWAFDVSKYDGLLVSVAVVNNYIIEISSDGTNFTEVANYSKLSSERAAGTNDSIVCILLDAYPEIGDKLYIRLRNTNPSMSWGGAVKSFTFQHIVPAQ